jgi:hypothetical protein
MKKPDDFSTLLKLKSLGWGEAGVRRSSWAPSNDGHGGGDGVCVAQATAAHAPKGVGWLFELLPVSWTAG